METPNRGSRHTTPALSPSHTNSSNSTASVAASQTLSTPASGDQLPVSAKGYPIPYPSWTPQVQKQKSHAKKRPEGHISRPRNAFMLFRSNIFQQKLFEAAILTGTLEPILAKRDGKGKVPSSRIENGKFIIEHTELSSFAGALWNSLSLSERRPWIQLAEKDRLYHQQLYPGYRHVYQSKKSGFGVMNAGAANRDGMNALDARRIERPNSCPPGAARSNDGGLEVGFGGRLTVRDDLSGYRRPTAFTLYTTLSEEERVFEEAFYDYGKKFYNTARLFGYIASDKRSRTVEKVPYSARFGPGVRPEDWGSDSELCDADGMSDSSDDNPISWGDWQDTWGGKPRLPSNANSITEALSTLPPLPRVPLDAAVMQNMQAEIGAGAMFSSNFGNVSNPLDNWAWPVPLTSDANVVGAEPETDSVTADQDWLGALEGMSTMEERRNSLATMVMDFYQTLPDI